MVGLRPNSSPGSPPVAATHFIQRVTTEGLWVARKGEVGKLKMVGVSKVPEARRPLSLIGLTPDLDSGAALCGLAQNSAFSLINKDSLLCDLNSGLCLLGRQEVYWQTGRAGAGAASPHSRGAMDHNPRPGKGSKAGLLPQFRETFALLPQVAQPCQPVWTFQPLDTYQAYSPASTPGNLREGWGAQGKR